MRDLIVQWLSNHSAFWKNSLSIDQFVTALQKHFIWCFAMLFLYLGLYQAIIFMVTRPDGILPNKAIYHSLNPIVNALRSLPLLFC